MYQTSQIIPVTLTIRQALAGDIPLLTTLMEAAVRQLGSRDYSRQQIESALEYIFGIDSRLIDEGTYYVAEIDGQVAGCGGWSRSSKLFGGNQMKTQLELGASPGAASAAKIRAFFVHPNYARQGIGCRLMQISELAARRAGFKRLELLATLTGEPLYRQCGFTPVETVDVMLPNGISLPAVKMEKRL